MYKDTVKIDRDAGCGWETDQQGIRHASCWASLGVLIDKTLTFYIMDNYINNGKIKNPNINLLYVNEIRNLLSPYIKDISPFQRVEKKVKQYGGDFRTHYYLQSTIKNYADLPGYTLLGILNLFKGPSEFPTVPYTYFYLRQHYPHLDSWQCVVLAHMGILPYDGYVNNIITGLSNHITYSTYYTKHVKDMTLAKVVEKGNLFSKVPAHAFKNTKIFGQVRPAGQSCNVKYLGMFKWSPDEWKGEGGFHSNTTMGNNKGILTEKCIKEMT